MSSIVDGSCTVIERSTHLRAALITKHTIPGGFVARLWSQMASSLVYPAREGPQLTAGFLREVDRKSRISIALAGFLMLPASDSRTLPGFPAYASDTHGGVRIRARPHEELHLSNHKAVLWSRETGDAWRKACKVLYGTMTDTLSASGLYNTASLFS
jgi:hypothetical protein